MRILLLPYLHTVKPYLDYKYYIYLFQVCFCSEECRDESWVEYHRLECSVLNHILQSTEISKMSWLVYRIATKAIFSQKKDFNSMKPYSSAPNPFLSDDYATVWGQVTNTISRTPADLLKRATNAIFLASLILFVAPKETDIVTLSTVLLRHLQSCSCNAYQITQQILPKGDARRSQEMELGGAVYPTISLSNHSCNPNVVRHSVGRNCVVRAIRNIKNGEEILDNYGAHFLSNSLEERQKLLFSQYFFKCNCEACVKNWPTVNGLNHTYIVYKCIHCSIPIENSIISLRVCPHCSKKLNFSNISKRLEVLTGKYEKSLEYLINGRLNHCLKTCVEYCNWLDSVAAHPNKQFVSSQQAVILCWSLMGNVKNV